MRDSNDHTGGRPVAGPEELDRTPSVDFAEVERLCQLHSSGQMVSASADQEMVFAADSPMEEVMAAIEQVACSRRPVLVLGETGAGKEWICQQIHLLSGRTGSLISYNCACLRAVDPLVIQGRLFGVGPNHGLINLAREGSRGVVDRAEGGTLLLDELCYLPLEVQQMLLRFIESGRVVTAVGEWLEKQCDVRLIVATNRNLREEVDQGRFLADLYYRLLGLEVVIPPLRDRRGDIPLLTTHFLSKIASGRNVQLGQDLLGAMLCNPWQGNVRELKDFVEAAATCLINRRTGHQIREPLLLDLSTLTELPIGCELKRQMFAAAAMCQELEAADRIGQVGARCISNLVELAQDMFPEAFAALRQGSQGRWQKSIHAALARFNTFLADSGRPVVPGPGGDRNVLAMLLDYSQDWKWVKQVLRGVLRRLRQNRVPISNQWEEPRYRTFEEFFGLKFDQLRKGSGDRWSVIGGDQ